MNNFISLMISLNFLPEVATNHSSFAGFVNDRGLPKHVCEHFGQYRLNSNLSLSSIGIISHEGESI